MIELTRCGAPDNDRYLPAVMTQGDASTYQTMIDNSTMQKRSQQMVDRAFGSAQSGTTQNGRQQGMAPSAVQGGAPPAAPDAVMGAQQIAPGLGPLPAAPNGMSVAEQILHSSWKSLMARNVGRSVIVSFLIGTQNTIVTHGILYEVGNDYIALYQPDEQTTSARTSIPSASWSFCPRSVRPIPSSNSSRKEKREKRGALLPLSLLPALRCA